MVDIGDICAVRRRRGLWVACELDAGSLPVQRWHVLKETADGSTTSCIAGPGDLTVVASPEINIGDWLTYRGRDSRVLAVTDESIRVSYDERNEVPGGGFIRHTECEADVPRASLVLENIRAFI